MNRREFLSNSALAAASVWLTGCMDSKSVAVNSVTGKKQQKPNVLFIFTDQQRHDTVSCYGNPIYQNLTPNIDKLAEEGVRFNYVFTPQPICGPARACLQSGRYPTEVGVHANGMALPQDDKNIASWMNEAGYEVGYLGKWHLGSDRGEKLFGDEEFICEGSHVPPERRGGYDDFWLGYDFLGDTSTDYHGYMYNPQGNKRFFKDKYRVDAHTDWAIEYLQNRKTDKPFFFFVSYFEPHHQGRGKKRGYLPPKELKGQFNDYDIPGDLKDNKGNWKTHMPDYLGCCRSLDDNVGRLVAELERQGIADNTLIVFTSDHGCHFGTRTFEYKRSCHDSSTRVPLVIKGPGFTGGKVVDELVTLLDLAPTLLSTADSQLPDILRGRPLQPLVAGNVKDWPKEVFIQLSESQVGRAIRTKKWTYPVRANLSSTHWRNDSFSDVYCEDYLYDNLNDPHQRNNLINSPKYAQTRAKLSQKLLDKIATVENRQSKII